MATSYLAHAERSGVREVGGKDDHIAGSGFGEQVSSGPGGQGWVLAEAAGMVGVEDLERRVEEITDEPGR